MRKLLDLVCVPLLAAGYLQSRSWQGLEQRLGETEVTEAVEGTTGIAAAYTHELIEHR